MRIGNGKKVHLREYGFERCIRRSQKASVLAIDGSENVDQSDPIVNKRSMQIPEVSVNQVLDDVQTLMRNHPSLRGSKLAIKHLDIDTAGQIGGTELIQILLNLTVNAFQNSSTPQTVWITAERYDQPIPIDTFNKVWIVADKAKVLERGNAAYVVAQVDSIVDNNATPYGSFLLKYNATDGFLWNRRITARSSTLAQSVAIAPSGVWVKNPRHRRQ